MGALVIITGAVGLDKGTLCKWCGVYEGYKCVKHIKYDWSMTSRVINVYRRVFVAATVLSILLEQVTGTEASFFLSWLRLPEYAGIK